MKKIIPIAAIFALTLGTQKVATAQTNKKTETKVNLEKQGIEKLIVSTVGLWESGVMIEEHLFWDNQTYAKQIGL